MCVRRILPALILCLALAPRPSSADPKWSRVDTPNFIVVGTQSEASLREIGKQFEGFREALTRLLSSAVTSTAVPTLVVAFPDDKTFQPFKPIYQGKAVDVGGLFVPRSHVNYILLGPDRGGDSLRPVFHEYSHLLINNVAPTLPLWLNEGVAEYYSTFELDSGGQAVSFGRPIRDHFEALNSSSWLPLQALLGTARTSQEYNEGARRGMFYAESWLLVHMLLHGEPDRRKQLGAYSRELASGVAPDEAWQHQFGAEDIFKAMQQYSRRMILKGRQYKLSDQIERAPGTAVPFTAADAEMTLGEILLSLQRPDPATQRFDRALALQPGSVRAVIGKAIAAGKAAQVTAAPAASADWFTEYTIGAALLQYGESADRTSLDASRAALERAAAAKPEIPNVQVLFALASERSGAGAASIVEALKKAHAAAPARDDYAIMLARALAVAEQYEAARMVLGRVMAHPSFPDARKMALAVMQDIVAAEADARRAAAPADPPPPDRPDIPATSEIEVTYRKVQAGEERVEGLLERIDCAAKRIVFAVRLSDRVARFQATSFDGVEFITYRTDLQGNVTCGARKSPDRVYVTYRPGDLDGTPVAIEFLPLK